jgi:hypothetical protein
VNESEPTDRRPANAVALERALGARLRDILSAVGWLAELPKGGVGGAADIVVSIGPRGGKRARLHVQVKSEVRPGTFEVWARRWRDSSSKWAAVPVLAAPVVSERLAEVARRSGWSWYDLAGNCWIDVPGLLHVERTGNPPVRGALRPGANLGTAAAARVVRALLSPTHAGWTWTQRRLRTCTCFPGDPPVSLGLVNKVARHLRDEGFLEDADGRGLRVRDPVGLLSAWRRAYRFDRHDRRGFFTLLRGAQLEAALYSVGLGAADVAVYAAFSAAERQAPHVRQPMTWLYVAPESVDALARYTEAKEVDSGENLVVLVPEDSGAFLSFEAEDHVGERKIGCTDPVQTYVDLCHLGGRGEEAAQAILEQRILPKWKEAGVGR